MYVNGDGKSRGIWRIKCLKLWMSQSWFSLGFLSQKFSLEFHGYKGIYSSVREESEKSFLCKTGHSGDLVS